MISICPPRQSSVAGCANSSRTSCESVGITAHFEDYRPYYNEATRISRELGMYRQNYCGCRFSVAEGEATRAFIKQQRKAAKEAKRAAREAEEAARREKAAEKEVERNERRTSLDT